MWQLHVPMPRVRVHKVEAMETAAGVLLFLFLHTFAQLIVHMMQQQHWEEWAPTCIRHVPACPALMCMLCAALSCLAGNMGACKQSSVLFWGSTGDSIRTHRGPFCTLQEPCAVPGVLAR